MIWCLLTSFEYIESLINVIEQHLSVYLRYLNIGVAKHPRYYRYRHSAVQGDSGEGMTGHVRRQMRNAYPLADDLKHKVVFLIAHERKSVVVPLCDGESFVRQPHRDVGFGFLPLRYNVNLASLLREVVCRKR